MNHINRRLSHFSKDFETTLPGTDVPVTFDAKGTLDHYHFGNDPSCQTDIEIGDVFVAGELVDPEQIATWDAVTKTWRPLIETLTDHAFDNYS